MKLSFKGVSKNLTLVIAAAVLAGSGATAVVFAAIPNSTTGVISACRANSDGAMRVIDAQAGATCEETETAINWASAGDGDSTHSASLRLEPNPEDSTSYVMSPARSRNIVQAVVKQDVNNPDYRALCVQVNFSPEHTRSTQAAQVGMGNSTALQLDLRSQGGYYADALDYYCGAEYNAIAYIYPGQGDVTAQSIFFSN